MSFRYRFLIGTAIGVGTGFIVHGSGQPLSTAIGAGCFTFVAGLFLPEIILVILNLLP